jgi:hypothetical protein
MSRGQHDGPLLPYSRLSRPEVLEPLEEKEENQGIFCLSSCGGDMEVLVPKMLHQASTLPTLATELPPLI